MVAPSKTESSTAELLEISPSSKLASLAQERDDMVKRGKRKHSLIDDRPLLWRTAKTLRPSFAVFLSSNNDRKTRSYPGPIFVIRSRRVNEKGLSGIITVFLYIGSYTPAIVHRNDKWVILASAVKVWLTTVPAAKNDGVSIL